MTTSWKASIPRLKPSTLEAIVKGSNPKLSQRRREREAVHQPEAAGDEDFPAPEDRDQGMDGRNQDRKGNGRFDDGTGQARPSERAEHERDRVAEGERGHDLDDPPQGRFPAGIAAPAPARRDERRREYEREQEQEVVGPLGDVARTEAEHGGESLKPTAPGAVDGNRRIGVAHRPQKHRLLAHNAVAPVAGQRDHRGVSDQMMEDHIVLEGQPVHRRAGWRSHRERHPHVRFLFDDRDHFAHRHRPGPPVGS